MGHSEQTTSDQRQAFLFREANIRGQWVKLDAAASRLLSTHDYPPAVQVLLAELAAAVVMMTATLKFEGTVSVHARGSGPVRLLSVEANERGEFRGVARHDAIPGDIASPADLLGNASLAMTIEPARGERYQGIVPLEGESIAACLESYFARSEQLPTRFFLRFDGQGIGGMMLQAMPGMDDRRLWEEVTVLADTLSGTDELTTLPPATLLHRLFHEHDVVLFDPIPVAYGCRCTRARAASALARLERDEVLAMLEELGQIEVTCEFCGQRQSFGPADLPDLWDNDGTPGTHRLH